jgi:hypothetical protein
LAKLNAQGVTTWNSPDEVLGGFVMGGAALREYAGGLLHTDDRPDLEFSAPRSAYLWTAERYKQDLDAVIKGGGSDLPDLTPANGPWQAQAARGFEAIGRASKARRLLWQPKSDLKSTE